jgi:hypothetical protein
MSIKEQVLLHVVAHTCRECDETVVMPGLPLEGVVEFTQTIACEKLCTTWTNVLSMRYDNDGGKVVKWEWEHSHPATDDYDDWSGP